MATKRTLRTCKNGHQYYKSGDCPTCPTCEEKRKKDDTFLTLFFAPARRALENNGITTLKQLSELSKQEILKFHGMGKSSIPKLQKLLEDKNLTFKDAE